MASSQTFDTDGETFEQRFPPRKRASTEEDQQRVKRNRSDGASSHSNGCLTTGDSTLIHSGHGSLTRLPGSFGSESDSSQKTIDFSMEPPTKDEVDSHSQSLLSMMRRTETLKLKQAEKSSALSKSERDVSDNVGTHAYATGQSRFSKTQLSSGANATQGSVRATSASLPPSQTAAGQSHIPQAVLQRIPSVQRDVEMISGILGVVQNPKVADEVYSKLCALRTHPQRVEVVTNAVLEEQTAAANHEAGHETRALMQDLEALMERLKREQPARTVDPNRVFDLLESHKEQTDRVNSVLRVLLQENPETVTPTTAATPAERTLMDDVQALAQKFPAADPNELYSLLEAVDPSEDRMQHVIQQLESKIQQHTSSTSKPEAANAETTSTAQDIPNDGEEDIHDAFLRDLDTVCKVFPDRDKNEIYALLESCPHQNKRVQEVIRQLMCVRASQDGQPMETDGPNWDSTEPTEPFQDDFVEDPLMQLKRDVAMLQAIVPDCDPNYLFEELESRYGNKDRVQVISAMLLESRKYPRVKERLEQEQRAARREKLFSAEIDVGEFLQTFPNPRETFYDIASDLSEGYKQHVQVHLNNIFPMVHGKFINKLLEQNNSHLTPVLRKLEGVMQRFERGERRGCFRHSARDPTPLPDSPDEYFYQELLFARNEQRITAQLEQTRRERDTMVTAARQAGALLTCNCCYEDELIEKDMLACPEGHIFCRDCIRRMALERIGQGLVMVECLDGECITEFDLNVLQTAMPARTFSVFLKKKQEEEVKAAGITDLETCPFCSFATIMPNHEDKVFSCLNPECFRQSCRLCKEPNHVPLRCEEVEKQNETHMRTALELRMTEAMLRTCPGCSKRFFKVEGCNKMTCTCGQSMCYICREPINDYDHFNKGSCNLNDMNALHEQEMMKAGEDALGDLKRDNPHLDITLDPAAILANQVAGTKTHLGFHYNEEYDEDEDDDYED